MTDHLSKAKEFASEKLGDLSEALSTHQKSRGLQKQIADLVSERDRVMLEIGRKVYALYGRDKVRNADILPLCESIDGIGTQIDALNVQVRELAQPKPKGVLAATELADETALDEDEPVEEAAEDEGGETEAPAAETEAEADAEAEPDADPKPE
jgi:hypothetical protein